MDQSTSQASIDLGDHLATYVDMVKQMRTKPHFSNARLEGFCLGAKIVTDYGVVYCCAATGKCTLCAVPLGNMVAFLVLPGISTLLDTERNGGWRLPAVTQADLQTRGPFRRHADLSGVKFGVPKESELAHFTYRIDGHLVGSRLGLILGAMIETVRDYVKDADVHLALDSDDIILICRDATIRWPESGSPGEVKGHDTIFKFLSACWEHARERVCVSGWKRPIAGPLIHASDE